MKEFIRKLLKEAILDEADYPSTFNIEEFKGQVTVKKILNKNTDCCTIGTVFEI